MMASDGGYWKGNDSKKEGGRQEAFFLIKYKKDEKVVGDKVAD